MALTIEDGTGVASANSYVTLADVRAFAVSRNITLPIPDPEVEALIHRAMDYVEAHRTKFKGSKIFGIGYLQWPRSEVEIDGFDLPETMIPSDLKNAVCQAACDLNDGNDPLTTGTGAAIKREKVDVIETEYAVSSGSSTPAPNLRRVEAMLSPLFRSTVALQVGRV